MRRQPGAARRQPGVAEVATVVQRLAVLLAAGVPPASAWGYVAETSASAIPATVNSKIVDATGIATAISESLGGVGAVEASAWRGLAAAWSVATDAGAPLAPSLRLFAGSLRALAQAQRDIEVALAGPAATARMVMVLPAVGVLFGMALGFNTIGTLLTTPTGIGCLALGSILILGASRWNRRLIAAAQPHELTPGLECELMAISVTGGWALDRARTSVDAAMERFALSGSGGVEAALELSRRAGVPAAELLRSEADEARRQARASAEMQAASLAVRLMLPLGLCILPAFMVLGVVPLLVTVISSTVAVF